jgi:hypothetical protein
VRSAPKGRFGLRAKQFAPDAAPKVRFVMKHIILAVASALAAAALIASPASAGDHRHKRYQPERYERDCTPINGRFGYYGNPWCDTGSYRQPDLDYRSWQRARARYRARG